MSPFRPVWILFAAATACAVIRAILSGIILSAVQGPAELFNRLLTRLSEQFQPLIALLCGAAFLWWLYSIYMSDVRGVDRVGRYIGALAASIVIFYALAIM
jgi:hypothetical protein